MIRFNTQRFGLIERPEDAVLHFPGGILGFELCHRWLLLSDQAHGALFWLQSVDHTELSLSVVDPREFISDYSLHLDARQLDRGWVHEQLVVLTVLRRQGDRLILDVGSPLLIHPDLSAGRQVFASGAPSASLELPLQATFTKQSA